MVVFVSHMCSPVDVESTGEPGGSKFGGGRVPFVIFGVQYRCIAFVYYRPTGAS